MRVANQRLIANYLTDKHGRRRHLGDQVLALHSSENIYILMELIWGYSLHFDFDLMAERGSGPIRPVKKPHATSSLIAVRASNFAGNLIAYLF